VDQARRRHRWIAVLAGSLAIIGAILAIIVNPLWALLAAAGGLALLFLPDKKPCSADSKEVQS
jgi:hypothetical protein